MTNTSVSPGPIINPKGKLPVGVSDFIKLVQGDYCFVDKSLFIKELLDSGDDVTLITRPRRFGKTINMHMLCEFLRQGVQKQNDLFAGLAIHEQCMQYQQERGKRPVVFITFRGVKESNWSNAYARTQILLSQLTEEVSRDAPVTKLGHSQQEIVHKVIHRQAHPVECESILAILTQLLTLKHNGITPWVLIDEYDAPMQAAYQHDYYKDMRDLMKGLLGDCLKDNPFLHRAVLTGILRIAKEDIFSELNNPGVFGVLDDRFASHFGFSEFEVRQLLTHKGLTDRFEMVQQTYDGYRFGQDTPATVYNPWSVIRYVSQPTKEAPLYWVNTSDNYLIHKLLSRADTTVKQGLYELLDTKSGHTTIQSLQEQVPLRFIEHNSKNLWGLLLASGYLTAESINRVPGSSAQEVRLCIPNEEVQGVYGDLLHRWAQGGNGSGGNGMQLLDALVGGSIDLFAEEFPKLVATSVGYYDTGGDNPERFYHAFVLGLMQYLRDRYHIRSERESGTGRYDLALEPKNNTLRGFVMEFKKGLRADGTLQQAAEKALKQIQDKSYHTDLLQRGIKQVIAIGLAFRGKQVAVAYTNLSVNS
ncbi:MAG: AAA family ATPase [Myxococcota bacterium]